MKPLSIADYLDRLGSAAGEKAPPRREGSPFRPRSAPSPRNGEPALKPVFDRALGAAGAGETPRADAPRRTPWAPKPPLLESVAMEPPPAEEPTKPDDISAKLADAYARGREQGLAEGRVEAADRQAAELAAARELAETQQRDFRHKEYAELEGAIRSGFKQIEDNVGGAVARILAPFLSEQVLKRAVDALAQAIARLSAGGSPGLIKIRGPERALALLRARISDLPIEVEYVEADRVETVVESNTTRIVAEFRSWAELLAAFEV
ncbi:MAG: hypothetical protein JOY52_15875 [Hyphomicrobiales bacterium]|nr:hypothetical protein [Hyphomicrobiales bacterium]